MGRNHIHQKKLNLFVRHDIITTGNEEKIPVIPDWGNEGGNGWL